MLLSSFVFTCLFANENVPPTTPRGQESNMGHPVFSSESFVSPGGTETTVLKNSPGETAKRLGLKNITNRPPPTAIRSIDFSDADQQFLVYISLTEKDRHMTVRKTVVGQSVCERLLEELQNFKQTKEGTWTVPCQIGVKLYRDSETGVVSPTSKPVSSAFDNSPASICRWLKTAESLNEGPQHVSALLDLIPKESPEFGNYPLGHTEQKACARGRGITPIYTSCQVEISKTSNEEIERIQQKRLETIKNLEECLNKMNKYLESDIDLVSPGLATNKVRTIANGIKEAKEVFAIAQKLRSKRAEFNPQFAIRFARANEVLRLIEAHFAKNLYRTFLCEPLLSGALTSSTPLQTCMEVPELLLNALKR